MPLDSMTLWQRTLAPQGDPLDARREVLRQALLGFRERVAALVQTLGAELPGLTVHDITHLDGLWRVADQIAGPDYPINPAEAFVLGGAFLASAVRVANHKTIPHARGVLVASVIYLPVLYGLMVLDGPVRTRLF